MNHKYFVRLLGWDRNYPTSTLKTLLVRTIHKDSITLSNFEEYIFDSLAMRHPSISYVVTMTLSIQFAAIVIADFEKFHTSELPTYDESHVLTINELEFGFRCMWSNMVEKTQGD